MFSRFGKVYERRSAVSVFWVLAVVVLSFLFPKVSQAQNLLANPGWEVNSSWTANNWGGELHTWGDDYTNPHGGTRAQVVNITNFPSGAGFIYKQDVTLTAGKIYEFSIWVRTTNAITAQFQVRTSGYTPYSIAQNTFSLDHATDPNWKQIVMRAGSDTTQTFFVGINFLGLGSIVLDDASVTDVTSTTLHGNGTPANTGVIPAEYFGVHFNKGHNNVWPAMNQGLVRMWDSGTMWKNIEPTNDAWNWARTDLYVNTLVRGHDTNCKIIMTLGQTPAWAAQNPTAPSAYGDGASSPPADLDEWREYVHEVATRYAGKIQYYELWNETNVNGTAGFYSGTAAQMVQMAMAAKEELADADPNAVLIAPNITIYGMGFLESFLYNGGDQYVDMYSIHVYTSLLPEDSLIYLTNIRDLLARHGITKPVWDTEGRAVGTSTPTASQSRAAVARNYLAKWAFGAENFSWYAYDINSSSNFVLLSTAEDSATLSDGGIAYREVAKWMKGGQMTYKGVDANGLWIVLITRADGYAARICWKYTSGVTASIPAGWGVIRRRNLDGTSSSMVGVSTTFIGNEPVLLENGTAF